jgi:hypothetical protein
MAKLNDAIVWRGGKSTETRTVETRDVEIEGNHSGLTRLQRLVSFSHYMSSKGGGTTAVKLEIGPASFSQVIRAMLDADRDATITAFASAVLDANKKKK